MAAPHIHHRAVHRALDLVLATRGTRFASNVRLGLSAAAAASLHLVRRETGGLTLGFDDDCAGATLPRQLRSPIDGAAIPVRAVRCAPHGIAHAPPGVINRTSGATIGTLAAILRDRRYPEQLFALTSGHVVAAQTDTAGGDNIEFVAPSGATLFAGSLLDWYPDFATPGEGTSIDAAIAFVETDALVDFASRSAERPAGVNFSVRESDALRLLARDRGDVRGHAAARVSCHMGIDGTDIEYQLIDVLSWDAPQGTQPGDSGAPVWDERDWLVGIHAGTEPNSPERPLCVPIFRILEYFRADPVLRDEALRAAPLAPPREEVFAGALPAPASRPVGAAPLPADANVLARTMWGEARGEGTEGMRAVAHVILNRTARQTYFGKTVAEVCRKPWHFSCWNLNDPNLRRLLAVDVSDAQFREALDIAAALLADARGLVRRDEDPTDGATHYHARALFPLPGWAVGHTPCARIGNHVFYNDIR